MLLFSCLIQKRQTWDLMVLEKLIRVEEPFPCFTFLDMIRLGINLYFLPINAYQVVVIFKGVTNYVSKLQVRTGIVV